MIADVTSWSPVVQEDMEMILSEDLRWDLFKNKHVLISGVGGFIARYLTTALLYISDSLELNLKVTGLARDPVSARSRFGGLMDCSGLTILEADLARAIPEVPKVDYVIHAASQASPKYFRSDPVGTMAANLRGSELMLEITRRCPEARYMFFSSSEIYGKVSMPSCNSIGETEYGYLDCLDVRSCYAESKRAGETLAISYYQQYGSRVVIVRPFHTYGPGMLLNDGRVFADFVRDFVEGRDIVIRSDGLATRAFCYLADAVSAFLRILLRGEAGAAYNVGNPAAACSVGDLAELIVRLFPERKTRVIRDFQPATDYMPSPFRIQVPDVGKLKGLGWRPKHDLSSGFSRTITHFQNLKTKENRLK